MTMHKEIQEIIFEFPEMQEVLYHNAERFFEDWFESIEDAHTFLTSCNGEYELEFHNDNWKVFFKYPRCLIIAGKNTSDLSKAAYIICILRDRISGNRDRDSMKVADIYDELYEQIIKLNGNEVG